MQKGTDYIKVTLIKIIDVQSKIKECVYKKLLFYSTAN